MLISLAYVIVYSFDKEKGNALQFSIFVKILCFMKKNFTFPFFYAIM